jgi:glycosyltransferase involved in cell wall biosynthesis
LIKDITRAETRAQSNRLRVAVFQRRVPEYRVAALEALANQSDLDVTVYAADFSVRPADVKTVRLSEFKLWQLFLHPRLFTKTFRSEHDVVLCEGRLALAASVSLTVFQGSFGPPVVWWTSLWRRDGTVGIPHGIHGAMTKQMLHACGAVAVYSRAAAAVAIAAGVPESKVFLAQNTLDIALLQRIDEEWRTDGERLGRRLSDSGVARGNNALFVGRLIEEKRLDILLAAWAQVMGTGRVDGRQLLIVGDGPEMGKVQAEIRARGLEGSVRLLGECRDYHDVAPFFLASRVVVMPGTGGLAINHAFAHAVPVIVGGGDGTERDLIDEGRNGYRVRVGDVEQLADRISSIVNAPDVEWQAMSRRARETVLERADMGTMVSGLSEALRVAVGAQRVSMDRESVHPPVADAIDDSELSQDAIPVK